MVRPIDPAIASPIAFPVAGRMAGGHRLGQRVGVLPVVIAIPLGLLARWAGRIGGNRGARAGITLAAYALFGLITGGLAFALVVAPLLFLGVVFAPDAVRELIAAARDRRRITVTRVVR